jgi:hypothetical protein
MRRRRAVPIVPLALAALFARSSARAESETERYMLRAELGAEYDSNAHRAEILAGGVNRSPVPSPVARGVVTGMLADVVSARHDVAMSATAAGKLFTAPEARDEDIAIAQSGLTWRMRLGERANLSVAGGYYEAFQRAGQGTVYLTERRDFRSLTPGLRLALPLAEGMELGVGGGYRLFAFKPDHDFDFQAPSLALDLRWGRESVDAGADWEAFLGAGVERRAFAGPALLPPAGDGLPTPGADQRIDQFLTTRAEVVRTARLLLGAGYAFHYNASNSYGETVARHFMTGRFATALPFDLFVTARADLLLAYYAEPPVVVGQTPTAGFLFASIEDENRSSVRADLSRALGERLQIIARYTYYSPPLTASRVTYSRYTALLSLAFTIEK